MSRRLETPFEAYCDAMVGALMHADRALPARWHSKGLLFPRKRKSVVPMAARLARFRPIVAAWVTAT